MAAKTTYQLMAEVERLLSDSDAKDQALILRTVTERLGVGGAVLRGLGGDVGSRRSRAEREREERLIRGTSSLGTAVIYDPLDADEAHDAAMDLHEGRSRRRAGHDYGDEEAQAAEEIARGGVFGGR